MPSAKTTRARDTQRYASKKGQVCAGRKKHYETNTAKCKEASKMAYEKAYASDPKKFKEASKKVYANNPEKFREVKRKAYANTPERFKKASKDRYNANPKKKRDASKKAYKTNAKKYKETFKANYCEHREQICGKKREEYVLRPPNEGLVKSYVKGILNQLLHNPEVKLCLTSKLHKEFPSYTKKLSNKMKARTACRLAARNIAHGILSLRKTNAGKFLKHVREINSLTITSKSDFGNTTLQPIVNHFTMRQPIYMGSNLLGV